MRYSISIRITALILFATAAFAQVAEPTALAEPETTDTRGDTIAVEPAPLFAEAEIDEIVELDGITIDPRERTMEPMAPEGLEIGKSGEYSFFSSDAVGIGTGAVEPGAQLEIYSPTGTGTVDMLRLRSKHDTGTNVYSLYFSPREVSYVIENGATGTNLTLSTKAVTGGSFNSGYGNILLMPHGNVGVANASPAYPLDVTGTARVTGLIMPTGAGANRVLTSDASGRATWQDPPSLPSDNVTGSGTQSYVSKFTSTGSVIGNSSIYDDGNVGIGTSSPSEKLHVLGNIQSSNGALIGSQFISNSIYNAADGILITTDIATSDNRMIELYIEGNSYSAWGAIGGKVQAYNYISTGTIIQTSYVTHGISPSEVRVFHHGGFVKLWMEQTSNYQTYRFRLGTHSGTHKITSIQNTAMPSTGVTNEVVLTPKTVLNNYVGIGTTSPAANLDVNGTAILQAGTSINEFSTDGALAGNSDNAVPTEKAVKTYVDGAVGSITGDNLGDHTATQNIELNSNWLSNDGGNEGIRIDNTGNVGIGTTSPTHALHISDGDWGGQLLIERPGGNPSIQMTNATTTVTGLGYDAGDIFILGTSSFRVQQNGNVGIGTTSPGELLDIYDDSPTADRAVRIRNATNAASEHGLYVSTARDANDAYIFQASSAGGTISRFYIRSDGNIGIGTTSPTAQLHTTGTLRFTGAGTPAVGRVLTTDASGNATWQDPPSVPANNVTGTGTQNYVSKFTSTGSVIGNSSIYDNGNVGIGTTSPNETFEINKAQTGGPTSAMRLQQSNNTPGAGLAIDIKTSTNTLADRYVARIAGLRSSTDNGSSDMAFYTDNVSGDLLSERMRILYNGNVGIGTASPDMTLDVRSTIGVATADESQFLNLSAVPTGQRIRFSNASHLEFGAGAGYGGLGSYSEIMRIDGANRKVGIGTTSPLSMLSVNASGNANCTGFFDNPNTTHGSTALYAVQSAPSAISDHVYAVRGVTTCSGGYHYGIYGSSVRSPESGTFGSGRTYGVFGIAGSATEGYNYGVYGRLTGGTDGAAVFGTLSGDVLISGQWAGYFDGDVYIDGDLTVTGSGGGGSDNDWAYSSGSDLTGNLYRNGRVGVGGSSVSYGYLQINQDGAENGLGIYNGVGSTFRIFRNSNIAHISRGGSTIDGIAIDASNNVGIGTVSPSAQLQVQPNTSQSAILVGRYSGYPNIQSSGDADAWMIIDGNVSSNGNLGLNYYSSGDVIMAYGGGSGGNVGIGTTTPASDLSVGGSGNSMYGIYGYKSASGSGGFAGVYGEGSISGSYASVYGVYGKSTSSAGYTSSYGVYANGTATVASSNSAYGIYATASGASSNYAGYFNGDVRVTGRYLDSSGDAGSSGQILSSTGTGTNWVTAPSGGGGGWTDGGTSVYLTTSTDNVGIGTSSPSAKLDIKEHTDTGIMLYLTDDNSSSGDLAHKAIQVQTQGTIQSWLATNGTAYFSGNVGIGYSSPASQLAVGGAGSSSYKGYFQNTATANGTRTLYAYQSGQPSSISYHVYALFGKANMSSTSGGYYHGIRGEAYRTSSGSGRSYGVEGHAGYASSGYNYAVYGYLRYTNNGAGVFGTLSGDIGLGSRYGGYFSGGHARPAPGDGDGSGHGGDDGGIYTDIGIGASGNLFGADIHGEIYGIYTEGGRYASYDHGDRFVDGLDVHLHDVRAADRMPLYTNVSTDVSVYSSGYGELRDGTARLLFDESFAKVVSGDIPVVVTVTPMGSCNAIYISEVDEKGFTVLESNDGRSNIRFSWIAVGRRAGYENPQLPEEVIASDYNSKIKEALTPIPDPGDDTSPIHESSLYYQKGELKVGTLPVQYLNEVNRKADSAN